MNIVKVIKCPICGANYIKGKGSMSRVDNKTEICPDCGIRQALNGIGVDADEQEKIIGIVHDHYKWLKERGLKEV